MTTPNDLFDGLLAELGIPVRRAQALAVREAITPAQVARVDQARTARAREGWQLTAASVRQSLDDTLLANGWEQTRVQRGKHPKTVTASHPRSYADDRVAQLLRHLSTALFEAVRQDVEEQEVQCMYVEGGPLVVCANQAASIGAIAAKRAEALVPEVPTGSPSERRVEKLAGVLAEKDKRYGRIVKSLSGDPRALEVFVELVEALRDFKANPVDLLRITANTLVDVIGTREMCLLDSTGIGCPHAEQSLVAALVFSGHKGRTHIRGKKRPCWTCYLTLLLAREAGFDIEFNPRPGNAWTSTTTEGLLVVAKALGHDWQSFNDFLAEKAPAEAYESSPYRGRAGTDRWAAAYDTHSDSE
ncbi:hypothetical protein [Umezawaea sp. Da 62-37]|uniref:hypothetical protein n=1 Tax=Umezawaea sp. Da 62-37 TaxID=3075927 RepID=UPI0028F6F022|nr:hypothetical protein [Umezawaea sp. Da 62-37]WNV87993.1 hypothetical protein RM788_06815 [Umezawaea sp. Da 62-37]